MKTRSPAPVSTNGLTDYEIEVALGYGIQRLTRVKNNFWAKVNKTDDCWLWTGSQSPFGYGHFGWRGRNTYLAHRVAWELANGAIPEGQLLLHSCDQSSCVRPSHLRLGTHSDNSADMVTRGRTYRGGWLKPSVAKHPDQIVGRCKLTAGQVRSFRSRLAGGESIKALAVEFGIASTQAYNIKNGVSWDIPEAYP